MAGIEMYSTLANACYFCAICTGIEFGEHRASNFQKILSEGDKVLPWRQTERQT